jgi:septal ring factor EnvC (AmiA/AmiB activator)
VARSIITIIIALALAGSLARAQSLDTKISAQKRELEQIQQEIKKHREKSRALDREQTNVMKQLSQLDKDIALSNKLLKGLEQQEALLTEQIDSLRVGVILEERSLDYQREKLARRLRQMYKRGSTHQWQFLLASPNMQDIVRRYKFMRLVAERDAALIDEVASRKLGLEHEQATLTEAMVDVVSLKAEHAQEQQRLESSKKDRVAMLSRIKNEKSKNDQAVEELKRSQEKLKDLIASLEQKRLSDDGAFVPTGDFSKLKGKLIRPVKGNITKKFGQNRHPKFGTVTFNNGVNIKAAPGTPIRAVAGGRVEFVDWISGYGNCIILNHGGGYYTLYAHVADIFVRPGQAVAPKDVIAEVGDSGSLNGYECHFEIRKAKDSLNPMDWFAK